MKRAAEILAEIFRKVVETVKQIVESLAKTFRQHKDEFMDAAMLAASPPPKWCTFTSTPRRPESARSTDASSWTTCWQPYRLPGNMKARCVGCGKTWNVSIFAQIPKTGYICPHCYSKRKEAQRCTNTYANTATHTSIRASVATAKKSR
jgi:DNA-directed RNA polymerase subunit RPC12/RpoP